VNVPVKVVAVAVVLDVFVTDVPVVVVALVPVVVETVEAVVRLVVLVPETDVSEVLVKVVEVAVEELTLVVLRLVEEVSVVLVPVVVEDFVDVVKVLAVVSVVIVVAVVPVRVKVVPVVPVRVKVVPVVPVRVNVVPVVPVRVKDVPVVREKDVCVKVVPDIEVIVVDVAVVEETSVVLCAEVVVVAQDGRRSWNSASQLHVSLAVALLQARMGSPSRPKLSSSFFATSLLSHGAGDTFSTSKRICFWDGVLVSIEEVALATATVFFRDDVSKSTSVGLFLSSAVGCPSVAISCALSARLMSAESGTWPSPFGAEVVPTCLARAFLTEKSRGAV
jgi:hypothetical protein